MDSIEEKFSFSTQKEGKLLQLCFSVFLFYNMSEDRDRQRGILDVLDEHQAMTGDVYRWTTNPKTHRWKKLQNGMDSYIHPRNGF